MMEQEGADISQIAAIEILIQAMDSKSAQWPAEVRATTMMLRRYIETHSHNYFSLAREAFSEIDRDGRLSIQNAAANIAQSSNVVVSNINTITNPTSVSAPKPVSVDQKPNYGWMLRGRAGA